MASAPSAARNGLLFAAFVAGYLVLVWVSYIHPLQSYQITPWNPQAALAIAVLMLRGQRWILAVAFAILAAVAVVRGAPHPGGPMLLIPSRVWALVLRPLVARR